MLTTVTQRFRVYRSPHTPPVAPFRLLLEQSRRLALHIRAAMLILMIAVMDMGRRLWLIVRPRTTREALIVLMIAAFFVLSVAAFAQTEEPTITIDTEPLFTAISTYVPIFFRILAVAGGILIGKRIAEYVIKAIADAF